MTTTVVKAADAAQFLSFVPRMLGYHPTQSLVVIPFHGARSLGAMRFDLPGDEVDAVDRVAATVTGMVCRVAEADAVAAVIYTGDRFDDDARMPHRELLAALERRADACGLRVTDLLCVAADGWGSFLDPGCPDTGRPLGDLEWDGPDDIPEPGGDQATGAELPACAPADRQRVARAMTALDTAVALLCGAEADGGTAARAARSARTAAAWDEPAGDEARVDPQALATVCRFDDLPTFFEEALSRPSETADAYDTAALVWCLARPSLRDVALVQWSGNLAQGDEAFDAQLRWESGEEYPAHLAMRMWGEGDRPQVARLETALELARRAAAAAPQDAQPGPLAMCAWLSWALGRSTHAAAYADRACDIEPEHGLSQIVLSFVSAGHLPDWAFQRTRTP